jgi:hypothetical protein
MGRVVILFSLAVVALTKTATETKTATVVHDESYYQKAVESDKKALDTAISKMDKSNEDKLSVTNRTHAKVLARSLAEICYDEAANAVSSDKAKAQADFNNAMSALKISTKDQLEDSEKTVRQKSSELDKLEAQEKHDAMRRLSNKGSSERKMVEQAYQKAKEALRNMNHDHHHLVKAMRHAHRGEHGTHGYETVDHDLEHWSEHREGRAEHLNEAATKAIERIFEDARDALVDKEMKFHQASAQKRNEDIEEALQAVREGTQQELYSAGIGGSLSLFMSVFLLAAGSFGLLLFSVYKPRAVSNSEPLLQTW